MDYTNRRVSDIIPIALLLTGTVANRSIAGYRVLEMLGIGALFLLAAKLCKTGSPGGDFKLMCSLTYASGIVNFLSALLLTGLAASVILLIRRQSTKTTIPFCTYLAPAFTVVWVSKLIIFGGTL